MEKNICAMLNSYMEDWLLHTLIVFIFDMWLGVFDEVIRLDPYAEIKKRKKTTELSLNIHPYKYMPESQNVNHC